MKKLHQESENSSKGEYIFGYLFGAIGILAGSPQKWFCLPLFMNLHRVKTIFSWIPHLGAAGDYDGATIAFVEYRDMSGENGKILTIDSKNPESSLRTVIETTDQTHTNLDPFYIRENEITFLSIPEGKSENEATRFIQNVDNNTRKILDVRLEGQRQLLRNFTFIQ